MMRFPLPAWRGVLCAILLCGAAIQKVYAEGERLIHIVAFGASQTAGKIVSREQSYPAQLERLLRADGFNVVITNAGISGDNSADLLRRFDRAIPEGSDIVLFQPGTNDCTNKHWLSEEDFRSNLHQMLSKLQARHLSVLVIGGSCYEDLQASMPGEFGIPYYGRLGQGLAAFPRPDGQHFTAEGYARLVQLLAPQVKQMIQALPKP